MGSGGAFCRHGHGVGAHRKRGTPGAVPADGNGSMRQGVKVAAEPRESVWAARSGNHIGHELGASGGPCSGIKDGGGLGGSVPLWLPDALEFQRWVVASCDTLAKAGSVISADTIPCPWNMGDVPLRLVRMARLIPLGVGSAGQNFWEIRAVRLPSASGSFRFKVGFPGGVWVKIPPPESDIKPFGRPRFAG